MDEGMCKFVCLCVRCSFFRSILFFGGRCLIDLIFGDLWSSFCSPSAAKERQKGTKQDPNGTKTIKMDPKGYAKRAKWRPRGSQDHPKGVSREGSRNRVAKKTLHRGKPSSKWVQNGTIFWAMWHIFELFVQNIERFRILFSLDELRIQILYRFFAVVYPLSLLLK